MEKKKITLWVMIIALIISVTSNITLIVNYPRLSTSRDLTKLVVGTWSGPYTLEIVDALDGAYSTNDVLNQVVETLFSHDLRDPDLSRINLLAESYFWKNKTILQIKLREDISFHDGTPFNSIAAKWNLDRLLYLTNCTGNNTGKIAQTQLLWMRPDGKTPIINRIDAIGEYNITIILNDPYGPFLNLLTCTSAGMISPSAHYKNFDQFIPLNSKIVGTGPFVYDHYTPDVEVVLSRWNSYRNNLAYFDQLIFKIFDFFDESDKLYEETVDGKIDFNLVPGKYLQAYELEDDITVYNFTGETGLPDLSYTSISFNNKMFNGTWRRAMIYAMNYSDIIGKLRGNNTFRAISPISPSFGLSYNESLKAIELNFTKAREIVVSMGFGNITWTDAQWKSVAESTNPFLTIHYTYYSKERQDLGISLKETFKFIGIHVELDDCLPYIEPWIGGCKYELFLRGWGPEYLEPYNMFDQLINSPLSSTYINDTILNEMMLQALNTTDDLARNKIYKDIQWYFMKNGFQAPLYRNKIYVVHSADLRNVPYNAMRKFQAYGMWRV